MPLFVTFPLFANGLTNSCLLNHHKCQADQVSQFTMAHSGGIISILSRVVVLAETDFDFNGRMLLGTLADLSSSQDPDDAYAPTKKGLTKIPDKTATQYLRKAWLL